MDTENTSYIELHPPALTPPSSPEPQPQPRRSAMKGLVSTLLARFKTRGWRVTSLVLVAVVGLLIWRGTRAHANATAADTASATAHLVPAVPVAKVTRETLWNEVTIPAEFRPYEEVELHAKVSGYISALNVDFGDHVRSGQLLAVLEIPELHDELNRASAALKRAEADYQDAHLIYTRLLAVDKQHPNLVAQQELDTAEARDRTTEAAIAGAKADVEKYQTMLGYTRITAPFDGVVTKRYVDIGTLIQAGIASETQSLAVLRVSDNYRLRLDFPVSVAYVKDVHPGDSVDIRVESLGDKSFAGKITRATMRVDEDTRTMMTEVEVPNPDLQLVPGMYASVQFKVQNCPNVLSIPIEAVPPGQAGSVFVVNAQNQIEERPVTLGVQTSDRYELVSGLKEGEVVLLGSRSQASPGQSVEPKFIGNLAQQ